MTVPSMDRTARPAGLILVVEDEAIIRDFVCEILQEEGFATHAEETADAALTYLEAHHQDVSLLLTDILMPGALNGADLANRVEERWPQMPVLITSGHETPESSGVKKSVAFVRKPWTIGQMLGGVEDALNGQPPLTEAGLVAR